MAGRIEVALPSDRTRPGTLVLKNSAGTVVAGPFTAGGIADHSAAVAHGNPNRSTVASYGNTPTGTYAIEKTVPTGAGTSRSAHSFGPHGAIVLVPTGGDAALAAEIGRTGLMIHGGDLSAAGGLRPTHGCIRLSNADMQQLLGAIAFLMATEAPPNACGLDEFPSVAVNDGTVIDESEPPDDDESDPPPVDGAAPPILP
jgi:hypothetical protein